MGSIGATEAKYAIDLALDNGINHFDVARSYGYGEAERFVGKMLRGRRNSVVIASKFGIRPNWKADFLRMAKPVLRRLRKQRTSSPTVVRQATNSPSSIANRFLDRIQPLEGKFMKESLEKSLLELRCDYLDYFLIHEPLGTLDQIDELHEMGCLLKKEGKIRALGLAFMHSQLPLHRAYLTKFDILQFNNPTGPDNYSEMLADRGPHPNVIFSAMTGGLRSMAPKDKLIKLYQDFPRSVVLCSMFNLEHLKENVQITNEYNANSGQSKNNAKN